MRYSFENLVFEGGGVKGIAYAGALAELAEKDILPRIRRVGGTSAGAIVAVLVGLGYTPQDINDILKAMNFKKFMDGSLGLAGGFWRLASQFGWYKGDYFRNWIADRIKEKTKDPDLTFSQAKQRADADREKEKKEGFRELYFMATDLSTGFSEVMSHETHPDIRVADAVRFSMSLPIFFTARRGGARNDVYVDGGVLDNYPIKLFDREKYLSSPEMGLEPGYYREQNAHLPANRPEISPYRFNSQTLGFRLDSEKDISRFQDHTAPPVHSIRTFLGFSVALIKTYMNNQDNLHLHSDDWGRTIYIDTLGVNTVDFDISATKKKELVESGRKGVRKFFDWYDNKHTKSADV